MNETNEWRKLMNLVTEFFELQNQVTKLRIMDLTEYIERPCSCLDCFMKILSDKAVKDDEKEWQEFDNDFREEWE